MPTVLYQVIPRTSESMTIMQASAATAAGLDVSDIGRLEDTAGTAHLYGNE